MLLLTCPSSFKVVSYSGMDGRDILLYLFLLTWLKTHIISIYQITPPWNLETCSHRLWTLAPRCTLSQQFQMHFMTSLLEEFFPWIMRIAECIFNNSCCGNPFLEHSPDDLERYPRIPPDYNSSSFENKKILLNILTSLFWHNFWGLLW